MAHEVFFPTSPSGASATTNVACSWSFSFNESQAVFDPVGGNCTVAPDTRGWTLARVFYTLDFCPAGYASSVGSDGARYCANVDECARNTTGSTASLCHGDASCVDTEGSFTCSCNGGYSGDGLSCVDVNECIAPDGCVTLLVPSEFILILMNRKLCTCRCMLCLHSFEPSHRCEYPQCHRDRACTLLRPRLDPSSHVITTTLPLIRYPCDPHGACYNLWGSFRCIGCNVGWTGDGEVCTDLDECSVGADTCETPASCSNTAGSFTCVCDAGWSGNGFNCTNINECTSGSHNCASNATCSDTSGSFTCACLTGYSGNGTTCNDVNECSQGTHTCAGQNTSTCTNTEGSYSCSCRVGFTGNGTHCADVNECSSPFRCTTNAACINTFGS